MSNDFWCFRFSWLLMCDIFHSVVVEEWSTSSWAKPGEGEECGQLGVSEERPSAVHLPAIGQWEAGAFACYPHYAAAKSRREEQTGCYSTRYNRDLMNILCKTTQEHFHVCRNMIASNSCIKSIKQIVQVIILLSVIQMTQNTSCAVKVADS